jgi:ribosomal protein S18 acetylase RimI-like enzyme
MIKILDHEKTSIAESIYRVFQVSYSVEARLLGAVDFPPLKRTVSDFTKSKTSFFGFFEGEKVVAVIEIEPFPSVFHICSLVVDPQYFRKGIAKELLNFTFKLLEGNSITVETGLANIPATNLYKKFGFKEVKQYDTSHGIRKIGFLIEKAHRNENP